MNKKEAIGYKFVTDELKSRNGDAQWKINEWKKCTGELELCSNGFHASHTPLESLQYTYGNRWFMVEAKGEVLEDGDKFCAREMRITREIPVNKVLVQFAILCARRCYPNYKRHNPEDKAVLLAIVAAEKCLENPSKENLKAARSAALQEILFRIILADDTGDYKTQAEILAAMKPEGW